MVSFQSNKILRADNAEDLNVTTSKLLEYMCKRIQQQNVQLESFMSSMQHLVDYQDNYQTQLLGFIQGTLPISTSNLVRVLEQQKAQLQSFTSDMQHQVVYQSKLLGFIRHSWKAARTRVQNSE